MSATLTHTTVNCLSYSAATAIIRYTYVKNSLKPEITEVMKKNSYKLKAILIVESMGLFNLCSIYFYQNGKIGKDRLPFLAYKACVDHLDSNFSIPFYKVLPVNQFLLWVTNFSIVAFNMFLYKYLDKQTKENTGNYFHSLKDPSIDDLIS